MDIHFIINKHFKENITFNPACFNFTEKEARKKKLWIVKEKMPSKPDLKKLWKDKYKKEFKEQIEKEKHEEAEAQKTKLGNELTKKELKKLYRMKSLKKDDTKELMKRLNDLLPILQKVVEHLGIEE